MPEDRSTLRFDEPHPMSFRALEYLSAMPIDKLYLHLESLSSCAIEGNRMAEVCAGTLKRLLHKEPVSDRYLLGLAWAIRDLEEERE